MKKYKSKFNTLSTLITLETMSLSNMNLGHYDDMYEMGIYTKKFTKLDGVEIVKSEGKDDHPFLHFLRGFSLNLLKYDIIHGWFHVKSGNAKFYVTDSSKSGGLISHAWKEYIRNPDVEVCIYSSYCGQLYEANDFDPYTNSFYKQLLNKIIEKIAP
jgi:hypothetical protein